MKLSRKQWETLDMVIENPSREGIDTIKFTETIKGWKINCYNSKHKEWNKEHEFIIDENGGRQRIMRFEDESI